jgi:hypothetical protein
VIFYKKLFLAIQDFVAILWLFFKILSYKNFSRLFGYFLAIFGPFLVIFHQFYPQKQGLFEYFSLKN